MAVEKKRGINIDQVRHVYACITNTDNPMIVSSLRSPPFVSEERRVCWNIYCFIEKIIM